MDLFDIPASFLIGALTGTGVGGGGLLVLYLTLLRGTEQIAAQRLNLILFIAVSCAAVPYHIARRKVDASLLFSLCAFALPGTLAGQAIRSVLQPQTVRVIFGSAMLLTGVLVLFGKNRG
jgi:uncharacterized membrane protein YfcA